jgi:hypothetical protein
VHIDLRLYGHGPPGSCRKAANSPAHPCRYISTACLSLLVLLAALTYLSHLVRASYVTSNLFSGSIILLLSALLVLVIGLLPFLSAAVLKSRNAVYNFTDVHIANMKFFTAEAAGQVNPRLVSSLGWTKPSKADSDMAVINSQNSKPLSGGWYTGPGLSKVTYPIAIAAAELAFASITHYSELVEMPSALATPVGDASAADDLKDVLVQGATYLMNCFDPKTKGLVAYVASSEESNPVAEWVQPSTRTTATPFWVSPNGTQGVETYAAVTAAFAALSSALGPWDETLQMTSKLLLYAKQTYAVMQASQGSYEKTFPRMAQSWPSDGTSLWDDKLLAASFMLLADGTAYRCAVSLSIGIHCKLCARVLCGIPQRPAAAGCSHGCVVACTGTT